eukprot:scaffold76515_cov54-Phaeocystis_antarctica.AAC.2
MRLAAVATSCKLFILRAAKGRSGVGYMLMQLASTDSSALSRLCISRAPRARRRPPRPATTAGRRAHAGHPHPRGTGPAAGTDATARRATLPFKN